ncbi:MAG: SDR family oxidoreductase, partial [Bacteroidota bacterium]
MSVSNKLKGKTVVITGGSSGIGKSLAFVFGREGANIVITGRDSGKLDTASKELSSAGIVNAPFIADASKEEDNFKTAQFAASKFGGIDILINNAGLSMRALFQECDMQVIRQLMEVNFFGTVYATHACLPYILKSKGSIVGISSIAGFRGLPGRTGYSASKFAMNGFLEALRTELMYQHVNVLTVCPGFTASYIRNTALGKGGESIGET